MTQEQIKNWRELLCGMVGPFALIMPDEMIIKIKDNFQRSANNMDVELRIKRAHELADKTEIDEDELKELHDIIDGLGKELIEAKKPPVKEVTPLRGQPN
jgi:hypothetical protein